MSRGTVVFDFDSTLVTCESLDEVLARGLVERPDAVAEVKAITVEGMEGRIPFAESLRRRLALAQPTRAQVEAFGREAVGLFTPGIDDLVRRLDAEIWIVSGALLESLLPVAARLGVPADRVVGVQARWAPDGAFVGLPERMTKPDLLDGRGEGWPRPRVGVGDGMSDYELFRTRIVDRFVAFTANSRRKKVVATGAPVATSVRELEYLLAEFL